MGNSDGKGRARMSNKNEVVLTQKNLLTPKFLQCIGDFLGRANRSRMVIDWTASCNMYLAYEIVGLCQGRPQCTGAQQLRLDG